MTDAKKAFIVSCNYRKAYPIIESLKKLGFTTVAGIYAGTDIYSTEALSRYVDTIIRVEKPQSSEKSYISSVIKVVKEYDIDIIIPIGFEDFMTLSKYRDIIGRYTVIPVDNYEKMQYVSNKWTLQNLADRIGIAYPRTFLLDDVANVSAITDFINMVGLPLVVKGLGDASKPVLVGNHRNMMNIIDNLKGKMLLQEFIVGFGAGYFCLSHNGEPLAEFMHKRFLEETPLGGPSVKACSYYDEELLKEGRKIVEQLKWTGVMMVEFRKEAETGRYYLLEINPKFWGSLELAYRAGVDFPRYFVEFFLEGKRPQKISYKSICFSWISGGFSSYSSYGFRTLREISLRILPKNPLLSDLHIHDPVNNMQKIMLVCLSILRSTFIRDSIPEYYFNEKFRNVLPRLRKLILDFDGTLVKLAISWNKIRTKLVNLRLIKSDEDIQEVFYKYKIACDETSFDKLNKMVQAHELEAVRDIVRDERLSSLIRGLNRLNVSFAIVSKNSKYAVTDALNKLGILNYIETVTGREDDVLRIEQIAKALREADPSTAIMVGDALSDVKAALSIGVIPCMIADSNIKRIQAKDLNVSYVNSVKQVLSYILKYMAT